MQSNEERLERVFEKETDRLILKLLASKDKLKLFLECQKKDVFSDAPVTAREIVEGISAGIPSAHLDMTVIEDLVRALREEQKPERRRIAKGAAPENGRDGKFVLLVKPLGREKGLPLPDYVDLRAVHSFDNIEQGTIIGRIYPPSDGTPGRNVFGKNIPAKKGKEVKIQVDSSITIEQPQFENVYQTLVANIAGYVAEDRGKLKIHSLLAISANVDFKTGDIDFVGSVGVSGNVMKNFRVFARDNIEISGDVLGGSVHSKTGSVSLKGLVLGPGVSSPVGVSDSCDSRMLKDMVETVSASIEAKTTIRLFRAEGARLEAGGDIHIFGEVLNSIIRTKGRLMMPKGRVLGGVIYSVLGIEAGSIGSVRESKTVIHLVNDVQSTSQYHEVMQRIISHQEAEDLLRLHLGPFADNARLIEKLDKPHQEKMKTLFKKLGDVCASKNDWLERQSTMLRAAKPDRIPRINILQQLFSGVEIRAEEEVFNVTETIVGPKTIEYIPDGKCFIVRDLEAF